MAARGPRTPADKVDSAAQKDHEESPFAISGSVGTPGGKGGGAPPAPPPAPHAVKAATLLAFSVTAPFRAKALPVRFAPEFIDMFVSARMLPTNVVPEAMVAELLTCHCTLQALPPLTKLTDEPDEVMSVLDIWKTKTALGLPWASRVSVPVRLEAGSANTVDALRERESSQIGTHGGSARQPCESHDCAAAWDRSGPHQDVVGRVTFHAIRARSREASDRGTGADTHVSGDGGRTGAGDRRPGQDRKGPQIRTQVSLGQCWGGKSQRRERRARRLPADARICATFRGS